MTLRVMASVSERLLHVGVLLLLAAGLVAQEKVPEEKKSPIDADGGPVTAFLVGRAITVSGPPLNDAVILVQDGKIKAVGRKGSVEIPPTAKRIEAGDGVALPGFVSVASLSYTGVRRYSVRGRGTRANKKVSEGLIPSRAHSKALTAAGITTACVIPTGGGLAGLGCLVRPAKHGEGMLDASDVVRQDEAVLSMGFEPGTASSEAWIKSLGKARKYLDDLAAFEKAKKDGAKKDGAKKPEKKEEKPPEATKEEKPAEEKPAEEEKPEKKEEAKKPDPKKSEPKEPKKDASLAPLVQVLTGEQAGILMISSAAGFLHFEKVLAAEKDFRPALMMMPAGFRSMLDPWRVVDQLKKLGVPVILPPRTSTIPRTITRRVPQKILLEKGVPVAIVPEPGASGLTEFRFRLLDLVRHGIPEDRVLRAVTLTPAEVLGIQDRCGSLEPGKDADLILFDGDPLAPTSQLVEVVVGGESVWKKKAEEGR